MRDETVLGWYDLRGTAYVTLDRAEDSHALAEVINHETTHHILTATTSFGRMESLVDFYSDDPEDPRDAELMRQCAGLLRTASLLPNEAAATYCGLAELDDASLATAVARLPPFYRTAHRTLEDLLPRDELEPMVRIRAARAIACRAMQTSLISDWGDRRLFEPENLSLYLADPRFSPRLRFEAIIRRLAGLAPDRRAEWAGRHMMVGSEVQLVPATPARMDEMEFIEVPTKDEWAIDAGNILRTLSANTPLDPQFPPGMGALEIALQPNPYSFRELSTESINALSCDGVDFVTVDHNGSQRTVTLREGFQIPVAHARVTFHRPDSAVPVQTISPSEETARVIEASDPSSRATVCVSISGLISAASPAPHTRRNASDIFEEMQSWAGGRKVLLYTQGQRRGLVRAIAALQLAFGRVQNHAMLLGRDWGLVLFRSSSGEGPLVVHPVLIGEWNRQLPAFVASFTEMDMNVQSSTFYAGDHGSVIPVLRFARAFTNDIFTAEGWEDYCGELAPALAQDPSYLVSPSTREQEFDHDHE